MTKATSRALLGITVASLTYGLLNDGPALARTQISSPFGPNANVQVYVGSFTVTPGGTAAVWRRASDGACRLSILGTATGLADDTELTGSLLRDQMKIINPLDGFFPICGFTLSALIYNGHYCDLYGNSGDDDLQSYTGDTWLFGGDGNDLLFSHGFGNLFGGNGNDEVTTGSSTFSSEGLFGEAGNDCVDDESGAAATVDCGAGTDTISDVFHGVPVNAVNCETIRNRTGCFIARSF